MRTLATYISSDTQHFLRENFSAGTALHTANSLLQTISGIIGFFETATDLEELKEQLFQPENSPEEADRTEYGDFQTNTDLALGIVQHLSKKGYNPSIVVEPTCGKGNFILASLKTFSSLKKVYGVEIYKPYVWETKFSILQYFLENADADKPEIYIHHCNVFEFEFGKIANETADQNILIIGNPPWVTNAMLSSLNSANLPAKSNFKKLSGFDAITGKSNFDIAEYILLQMLDTFQHHNGELALLVKNSVIKNVMLDQKKNSYSIGNIEKQGINSKKEFDVSVEAALFFCQLNVSPEYACKEYDFYNNQAPLVSFGWTDEKFVSNIDTYLHSRHIDGISPFEWRQGLKHDCAAIMELEKTDGYYINALKEKTELESDLVYGVLKSSDLKSPVINKPRKYTIVTQKKVGQDTSYIRESYPFTYQYLTDHGHYFNARKSSIYKNKPSFSIFGIGDYSFKPYKVAISGLYKTYRFTLVLPADQKPLMLDDTCYMLGFDDLDYAAYTYILLNSQMAKELLQAITFLDAKRTFTKDILMRIDLQELSRQLTKEELEQSIEELNEQYFLNITANSWESFTRLLTPEAMPVL